MNAGSGHGAVRSRAQYAGSGTAGSPTPRQRCRFSKLRGPKACVYARKAVGSFVPRPDAYGLRQVRLFGGDPADRLGDHRRAGPGRYTEPERLKWPCGGEHADEEGGAKAVPARRSSCGSMRASATRCAIQGAPDHGAHQRLLRIPRRRRDRHLQAPMPAQGGPSTAGRARAGAHRRCRTSCRTSPTRACGPPAISMAPDLRKPASEHDGLIGRAGRRRPFNWHSAPVCLNACGKSMLGRRRVPRAGAAIACEETEVTDASVLTILAST